MIEERAAVCADFVYWRVGIDLRAYRYVGLATWL